jgi:hypothetical protein
MNLIQLLIGSIAAFFCLWTALLARLKGYSAICWLMGGGAIGVLILCFLPQASRHDWRKKTLGNLLGLILSILSLGTVFLCF